MRFKPSGQTLALTLTGANATFAGTISSGAITSTGDIKIQKNTPLLEIGTSNVSIGNAEIRMFSKNNSNANAYYLKYNKDTNIDRLEFIDGSGNANIQFNNGGSATFAGTIDSGSITSTGTIDSGTITSTGIVKAATTFQSTAGSMTFYVPNVGQALEIAQNTGNATFAGTIASGNISVTGGSGGNGQIDVLRTSGANVRIQSQSATGVVAVTTNHPLHLKTNDTTRVTITAGGDATFANDVTVSGDLNVTGTTTTVNQTNLDVTDNIIGLNRGSASNANDSGIIIERGDVGNNAALIWDEGDDHFVLGTTTSDASSTGGSIVVAGGNLKLGGLLLDGNTITGIDDSEEFTNDDAHIMTSAAIEDKILGYNYAVVNANTTGSSGSCTGNAATATTATTATTANAVAWGNITSRPYIVNATIPDIDSTTTTIANVAKATYTAAFFDYVIKKGENVRAGVVYACHDGTNVEFAETSTVDLGDTSDVTLSITIDSTNMMLKATTTSNDWSVKSLIRAI